MHRNFKENIVKKVDAEHLNIRLLPLKLISQSHPSKSFLVNHGTAWTAFLKTVFKENALIDHENNTKFDYFILKFECLVLTAGVVDPTQNACRRFS